MQKSQARRRLALEGYRVLDFTDQGCMLGSRLLADLGADVIMVEPPRESASSKGPSADHREESAKDEFSREWLNSNKRSISLALTAPRGREIIDRLVGISDIVMTCDCNEDASVDEFLVDVAAQHRSLIWASISMYGRQSSKKRPSGSDLVAWASGGYLSLCGDPDRSPTRVSVPQARSLAGAHAAAGALIALWHRRRSGVGQYVDVSVQECMVAPTLGGPPMWRMHGIDSRRIGWALQTSKGVRTSQGVKCADGYVALYLLGGGTASYVRSMQALVAWMDEEDAAPEWLRRLDWREDYDAATLSQDLVDQVETAVEAFARTKSKLQFSEEGVRRGVLTAPSSGMGELLNNEHLQERGFWIRRLNPNWDRELVHPGPFIRMGRGGPDEYRPAPRVGQDNRDVYQKLLGLDEANMVRLRAERVI